MRTAVFASGRRPRRGWQARFDQPQSVHVAYTHQDVLPVIHLAEEAALSGRWVAMMVAYEAAAAFDPAMQTHSVSDFPLVWAAVFDELAEPSEPEFSPPDNPAWQPQVSR